MLLKIETTEDINSPPPDDTMEALRLHEQAVKRLERLEQATANMSMNLAQLRAKCNERHENSLLRQENADIRTANVEARISSHDQYLNASQQHHQQTWQQVGALTQHIFNQQAYNNRTNAAIQHSAGPQLDPFQQSNVSYESNTGYQYNSGSQGIADPYSNPEALENRIQFQFHCELVLAPGVTFVPTNGPPVTGDVVADALIYSPDRSRDPIKFWRMYGMDFKRVLQLVQAPVPREALTPLNAHATLVAWGQHVECARAESFAETQNPHPHQQQHHLNYLHHMPPHHQQRHLNRLHENVYSQSPHSSQPQLPQKPHQCPPSLDTACVLQTSFRRYVNALRDYFLDSKTDLHKHNFMVAYCEFRAYYYDDLIVPAEHRVVELPTLELQEPTEPAGGDFCWGWEIGGVRRGVAMGIEDRVSGKEDEEEEEDKVGEGLANVDEECVRMGQEEAVDDGKNLEFEMSGRLDT